LLEGEYGRISRRVIGPVEAFDVEARTATILGQNVPVSSLDKSGIGITATVYESVDDQ